MVLGSVAGGPEELLFKVWGGGPGLGLIRRQRRCTGSDGWFPGQLPLARVRVCGLGGEEEHRGVSGCRSSGQFRLFCPCVVSLPVLSTFAAWQEGELTSDPCPLVSVLHRLVDHDRCSGHVSITGADEPRFPHVRRLLHLSVLHVRAHTSHNEVLTLM